ncbi:hypothetical protein Verru16b_03455 [Lacunisphaera limnophila]|uniref:Uncharacterized protein n=1 Tax=Lacunisphaera limnophila TaxID=1838286 RepID=A0A1D8AZQ2_9BACT|nr:hypothetical protein Verru16b_03455 [Lacunisphaera limnophila]
MPSRDQRLSLTASPGARSVPGLGATGFRLRLSAELSAGDLAFGPVTAGKLRSASPVITQR